MRSQTSPIMDLIGLELSELFALEFAKIAESDFLHSSIYKCRPMRTKHGHNIYDSEILDESNYGSNLTYIWSYLLLNKEKLFNLTGYTLASTNNNQSAPNLVMDRKIFEEFNYECNQDRIVRVICPLFEKNVTFDFVYTLSSAYIDQSAPKLGKIFMSNSI